MTKETYLKMIDRSSFNEDLKTTLSSLVKVYFNCREEEQSAQLKLHEAKKTINVPQYQERLKQAKGEAEMLSLIEVQLAWRNLIANSVLRLQQVRKSLKVALGHVGKTISSLSDTTGDDALVLLEIWRLWNSAKYEDADEVLKDLDGITDLTRRDISRAVCMIFRDVRRGYGMLNRNFSSEPLLFWQPTSEQRALSDAISGAIAAFWDLDRAREDFLKAKGGINRKQFDQRFKTAKTPEEKHKIENERRCAEAGLYVAVQRHVQKHSVFCTYKERLAKALKIAAEKTLPYPNNPIADNTSDWVNLEHDTETLASMSNCLGGSHWLFEMEYRHNQFADDNSVGVLEPIGFDASAFLKSIGRTV